MFCSARPRLCSAPDPSTPQRMLLGWGCTFSPAQPPAPRAFSSLLWQPGTEHFAFWSLPAAPPGSSCPCQQTWGKHKHREPGSHSWNERNETKQHLSTNSNTLVWRWRQDAEPGSLPPPSTHLQTAINSSEIFGYRVTGSVIRKMLPLPITPENKLPPLISSLLLTLLPLLLPK